MKEKKLTYRAAWRAGPPGQPRTLRSWLTWRGSLTSRIVACCGISATDTQTDGQTHTQTQKQTGFRLTRLMQRYRPGNIDELPELGLRFKQQVLVREVILWNGDTPLVFAHSLAARRDLYGAWRALKGLGTRPLAAMLFADARIARLPIEFKKIDKRHPLYRRAHELCGALPKALWARRSVFLLRGRRLLVTEVFLPGILLLPGDKACHDAD